MDIGIIQENFVVGDCAGNTAKILRGYRNLCNRGAGLVVATELSILGYPPKDLLDRPKKVEEQILCAQQLDAEIGDVGLIYGVAELNPASGKPLFNTARFTCERRIIGRRVKELLPTYDVFDESRYFQPGPRRPCIVPYRGKRIGILLCEDAWGGTENPNGGRLYDHDPVDDLVLANPDELIIVNASPYYWGKGNVRFELVRNIARRIRRRVTYVNEVGGYDDLVCDGRSFSLWEDASVCFAAPPFIAFTGIVPDLPVEEVPYAFDDGDFDQVYEALVLGTRDYMRKTGFTRVVIAESGGVDSALTTVIACDAAGAENVTAIGMPSGFSSAGSVADARELCANLNIGFELIPIGPVYDHIGDIAKPVIGWRGPGEDFGKDVTEENVQARLRGLLVMAYSNRFGALVLTTGNKSEIAVGYCTLYGDMAGGLAVIADLPKTLVFHLCRWYNANRRNVIPTQIIEKQPSAELRPDQKDQDSLPPYDVLDDILHEYVENALDLEVIVARGVDRATAASVIAKVDRNEYKRQQGALGLKVTTKAFGSGRRMPIATKPEKVIDMATA